MRDLVGLHATDTRSPYLQLRARAGRFQAEQLDDLLDRGRAAKLPCMRGTLFVQPAELIPIVAAATRAVLSRGHERYLADNGLSRRRYRQLADRVAAALSGEAMDARQLRKALGTREALPAVLHVMCDELRIVRWKGPRGWSESGQTYRLFEEALPGVAVAGREELGARQGLIERYIRCYGPVSVTDVSWWTGFNKAAVTEAVAALLGQLVSVEVDGLGAELLMHAADEPGGKPPPRSSPEVSLLPILDPYLQGYHDRDRYVEPAHQRYVFDPKGNSTSVILVAGRAAGVWDLVEADEPELRVFFFERHAKSLRQEVLSVAADTGAFLHGDPVPVVDVDTMKPLTQRAGWVLAPLK